MYLTLIRWTRIEETIIHLFETKDYDIEEIWSECHSLKQLNKSMVVISDIWNHEMVHPRTPTTVPAPPTRPTTPFETGFKHET